VFAILRVGENSDNEDFDEPKPSMCEVDAELHIKQVIVQEDNIWENEIGLPILVDGCQSRNATSGLSYFSQQNG